MGLFGDNEGDCCCGGCTGCCMPIEDGVPQDIPFDINAGPCVSASATKLFNPLALMPVTGLCGLCGAWGFNGIIEVQGGFWNFNGIDCDLVPGCTQQACLQLVCDSALSQGIEDNPSSDACCRKMRLGVATIYEVANCENIPNSLGCSGFNYIRWYRPDSCTCTDGVLSAIFTIDLNPIPKLDTFCGMVQPCVPSCAANAIEIVI